MRDLAEVVAAAALVGLGEQPPLKLEAIDALRVQGQTCHQFEDLGPADPGGLAVDDEVPLSAEGLQHQRGADGRRLQGGRAPPHRRRRHQAPPA